MNVKQLSSYRRLSDASFAKLKGKLEEYLDPVELTYNQYKALCRAINKYTHPRPEPNQYIRRTDKRNWLTAEGKEYVRKCIDEGIPLEHIAAEVGLTGTAMTYQKTKYLQEKLLTNA